MDEKKEMISQYFFDGEMARMERHVKRWFIGWIITFAALILSNIGWLYYESQFQDIVTTSQEVTQEGDGENKFEGDFYGGDYYGEADYKKDSNQN